MKLKRGLAVSEWREELIATSDTISLEAVLDTKAFEKQLSNLYKSCKSAISDITKLAEQSL